MIIIFFISSCRIGGFPPRLGFFVKLIMVKEIIIHNLPLFFIFSCITLSLLILRFYISFNISFLPWFKSSFIIKSPTKLWLTPWLVIFLNIISVLFFIAFYNPLYLFWK
jgi:formate hydrogenlyase subunit 3/multisubunit Na+/H+ antiporter MnhD subunit